MSIELDATQPIPINLFVQRSKGAEVEAFDGDYADVEITATSLNGEFGTINDAKTIFNPGNSGTTGTLKAEVDGLVAEAAIVLVSGSGRALRLVMVPTADHPSIVDDIRTLPTAPGRDDRPADPPHLAEYQATVRDRVRNQGNMDLPSNYTTVANVDTTEKTVAENLRVTGNKGEYVEAPSSNPSSALTNSHAAVGAGTKVLVDAEANKAVVSTEIPGAKDDSGDKSTFENTHGSSNGQDPVIVKAAQTDGLVVSESRAVNPEDTLKVAEAKVPTNDAEDQEDRTVVTDAVLDDEEDEEEDVKTKAKTVKGAKLPK